MSGRATSILLLVGMITTIVAVDVAFLRHRFALRLITNVGIAAVFVILAIIGGGR